MTRYPVLQSGFASLTEKNLEQAVIEEATLRDSILGKEYRKNNNRYFYSPEVSKLFTKWRTNPEKIREFEFREKIIKTAISAFATPSIYRWIMAQNDVPTVSALHRVFIIETLDMLMLNKPRELQISQWVHLLEASEKVDAVRVNVDRYFDGEVQSNGPRLPSSIYDLLQIWLSQNQGFVDLLITLYVIFGDRKQRSDVANIPES